MYHQTNLEQRLNRTKWLFALICILAMTVACGEDTGSTDTRTPGTTSTTTPGSTASGGSGASSTTSAPNPEGYSQVDDSSVSLNIQGSAPVLALMAAPIQVIGTDGTVIGQLDLATASIVLDKIKLKMEGEASTSVALLDSDDDNDDAADEDSDSDDTDEADAGDDDADDDSDSSGNDHRFKGPFIVDLLTNTISPEPAPIAVPAGTYKEIELSMHKVEDEDAEQLGMTSDNPLYERSIYVEGTYTPVGGATVAFSMEYDLSEDFKLRGEGGMDVSAAAINDFVIAFRLAHWFDFTSPSDDDDAVDFRDIPAGDIALVKDAEESLKQLRKAINENIKNSADFGKDQDGDGKLADDEDAETPEEEEDEGADDSAEEAEEVDSDSDE